MDWRERKYYLVSIPWDSRDMRMRFFKNAAPSLKMSAPYGHKAYHVDGKKLQSVYDGVWYRDTGLYIPDCMMSCRTEEAEALEYELRKMVRNDGCSGFYELTKEFCGQ